MFVVVYGLLPRQARVLEQEFGAGVAVMAKDGPAGVRPNAAAAVAVTRFMSHTVCDSLAALYGRRFVKVDGGVTRVRAAVRRILAAG